MVEVTDEMRAAVIAELRQRVVLLAPAGRRGFPGICGVMSTNGGPGEPFNLYSEERTLKAVRATFLLMLAMAAGAELYRPSNGTEGMDFCGRFCARCTKDNFNHDTGEGESCPILSSTFLNDFEDPEYPTEWRQDGPQGPRCSAFEERKP